MMVVDEMNVIWLVVMVGYDNDTNMYVHRV